MANLLVSRTNYLGTENHYDNGMVLCFDPQGNRRPCDPTSVAEQSAFYAASQASSGVLEAPTYQLLPPSAPAMPISPYVFRPDPRGNPNIAGSVLAMAVSGTPQAGQPTGSWPGWDSLPQGGGGDPYLSMTAGQIATALGAAGCNLIADPVKRALCVSIAGVVGGIVGGGGTATPNAGLTACNTGYVRDASGACVPATTGVGGQTGGGGVPYGQTATPADVRPVMGLYGAGITPYQVGNIGGRPILRCPIPGMVLGKDQVCYNKRDLRQDERKWRPARRPPMTGAEAHTLRSVAGLKKKAKKLAQLAGYAVGTRGRRSVPSSSRKK